MDTPTNLTHPAFHDENAARHYLEGVRWPNGPVCPYCNGSEKVAALGGKSMGDGWYHCKDCRKKFTVRVGSIFERSHIALHKWLMGFRLMAGSKKGFSAHQLHRSLGITYKSAWFMEHRIREAMKLDTDMPKIGGGGGTVEADETFIGNKPGRKARAGFGHKHAVMSLVERNGTVRSFHVANVTAAVLRDVLDKNVERDAHLRTDEHRAYVNVGWNFRTHRTVTHSIGEYVRGDVHTNTIEGFFSILKRGINGTYQHVSAHHLSRYLAEFDFRYSNRAALGVDDATRTELALKGAAGKRLTYNQSRQA